MIDFKKGNYQAVILSIIIGTGLLIYQNHMKEERRIRQEAMLAAEVQARADEPATNWFEVTNIAIPNFIEGEDPNIIYDRKVKKAFAATWSVEIHRADEASDYSFCGGSGTSYYEPKESLPKAGVKLSWFVGKDCKLPPGQYTTKTHWEIRPVGYPNKEEDYTTNLFRVLPVGSQLFITPEQSQKLEELPTP